MRPGPHRAEFRDSVRWPQASIGLGLSAVGSKAYPRRQGSGAILHRKSSREDSFLREPAEFHAPIATACRGAGDESGPSIGTWHVRAGFPASFLVLEITAEPNCDCQSDNRRMCNTGMSATPREGEIHGEPLRSGHAQRNPVHGVVEIASRVPVDCEELHVASTVGRS